MSQGLISVSVSDKWKTQVGVINVVHGDNKCKDIKIYLYNFSQDNVVITAGELFCYLQYLKY